jgi:hypothetical protein
LTGAELVISIGDQTDEGFNFLIVRSVILGETAKPVEDHQSCADYAKMGSVWFMVQEAINPSIRHRAMVVGGVPAAAPTTATTPQNQKKGAA